MIKLASFVFIPALIFAQADYTLTARVNPGTVYAGNPLTIEIAAAFAATPYTHIHPTLTPSSPAVTAQLWCGIYSPNCWGTPPYIYNTSQTAKFYVVATAAAPGSHTITVATAAAGITKTLTLPITVLPVPTSVPKPPVPPLPAAALAAYETGMLITASPNPAAARCDPANPGKYAWTFGVETQAWYYDGALVYFEIADYTRDPKWKICALSIADGYQNYVMTSSVPGWRVFTQGQLRAYQETGNTKYLDAIKRLIGTGSPYGAIGGDPADNLVRETAYMLRAYTDAHIAGLTTDPAAVARSLNYLLGIGQTLFSAAPMDTAALTHQSFMDGLFAEALTYYYDHWTPDPRIPAAIKQMCDWTWRYMWNDTAGTLQWNPFPPNATYPHFCASSCQAWDTGLIGLVMPAYWWYWHLSGDDTYRIEGDHMFTHISDTPTWSGKEQSQRHKWTIPALIQWRLPRN